MIHLFAADDEVARASPHSVIAIVLNLLPAPEVVAFTVDDMLHIGIRAATLHERLREPSSAFDVTGVEKAIRGRLDRWCAHGASGDWSRLEHRLRQLGHDLQSIQPYLGSRVMPSEILQFAWTRTLDDAIQDGGDAPDLLDPTDPIPFEHALLPFVVHARARLSDRCDLDVLAQPAERTLARHLLKVLSVVADECLHLEFSIFREHPSRRRTTGSYAAFCRSLLDGGYVAFFREYSFLARRIVSLVDTWVDANAELVDRLAGDHADIARTFAGGAELGAVVAIRPGLSDRHNGGRAVAIITFENGTRIVYKPKCLAPEAFFWEVVAEFDRWANDDLALTPPRARYLLRDHYGWAEYIEHADCDNAAQVARWFTRCGRLLGIIYGMNGYDFHAENLIACGEYPVPVDFETLFNPDQGLGLAREDHEQIFTVLTTAIVPQWSDGPHLELVDVSGLARESDASYAPSRTWIDTNRDAMSLGEGPSPADPMQNLPRVGGVVQRAEDHLDELQNGFGTAHDYWMQTRGTGLDGARTLTLTLRHIARNTRTYAVIAQQGYTPAHSREGVDVSLLHESLSRAYLDEPAGSPRLALLDSELRALVREDVPVFQRRMDSTSMCAENGVEVLNYFKRSGYDTVMRLLSLLGPDDRERQTDLIRAAFYVRHADPASLTANERATPPSTPQSVTLDKLVSIAMSIGDRLVRSGFPDGAGNLHWYGISPDTKASRYRLGLLNSSFYDGNGGIAVFLAALERAVPDRGYGAAAHAALRLLSKAVRERHSGSQDASRLKLGGMSGMSSIVYSFATAAELLGDSEYLADATAIAAMFGADVVARDDAYDVMGGSAGAILALLALYRRTRDPAVAQRAIACGDHLLAHRVPSAAGPRSWSTLDGRCYAGFSHGAAGIAYALTRLSELTHDVRYSLAALEAVEFEHTLFDAEAGNWLDLRTEGRVFTNQWCHGATGIGYGRLGMWPAQPSSNVMADVQAAVDATARRPLAAVDHLCCGNAGHVSFLFDAARATGRAEWKALALRRLEEVIGNSKPHCDAHHLTHSSIFQPQFMQGGAGIGYAWLRIAKPELNLPSPLLLE